MSKTSLPETEQVGYHIYGGPNVPLLSINAENWH
jgi:hypothetical protein